MPAATLRGRTGVDLDLLSAIAADLDTSEERIQSPPFSPEPPAGGVRLRPRPTDPTIHAAASSA